MTSAGEFIAVLEIEPTENSAARIADYYIEHRVIEAGKAYGLLEGILTIGNGVPPLTDRLRVLSSWPDATAYQSWLDAPERQDLVKGMQQFIKAINLGTDPGSHIESCLEHGEKVIHQI